MKLTVEGTAEEIKNVLQAISGSEEHEKGEVLYENEEKILDPYQSNFSQSQEKDSDSSDETNTKLEIVTPRSETGETFKSLFDLKSAAIKEIDESTTYVKIQKSKD